MSPVAIDSIGASPFDVRIGVPATKQLPEPGRQMPPVHPPAPPPPVRGVSVVTDCASSPFFAVSPPPNALKPASATSAITPTIAMYSTRFAPFVDLRKRWTARL